MYKRPYGDYGIITNNSIRVMSMENTFTRGMHDVVDKTYGDFAVFLDSKDGYKLKLIDERDYMEPCEVCIVDLDDFDVDKSEYDDMDWYDSMNMEIARVPREEFISKYTVNPGALIAKGLGIVTE